MTADYDVDNSWQDFYSIQLDIDSIEAMDPNKDYNRLTLPVLDCDRKGMHKDGEVNSKPKRDSRTRRLARAKACRLANESLDNILLGKA